MDKYKRQLRNVFGDVEIEASGSVNDPYKRDFYEVLFETGEVTFLKKSNLDTKESIWTTTADGREREYATLEEAVHVTALELTKRSEKLVSRLQCELEAFKQILSHKE